MELIDTSLTKVVDIDGTAVTIKPLTPNQRRKAMLAWGAFSPTKDDKDEENAAYITLLTVDRDKLAQLILPAIESIDRTTFSEKFKECPIIDILEVMEDADFWKLALLIIPNTGLKEEEVKNSDSSSEQDSPESKDAAGTPVKKEEELVSTTSER